MAQVRRKSWTKDPERGWINRVWYEEVPDAPAGSTIVTNEKGNITAHSGVTRAQAEQAVSERPASKPVTTPEPEELVGGWLEENGELVFKTFNESQFKARGLVESGSRPIGSGKLYPVYKKPVAEPAIKTGFSEESRVISGGGQETTIKWTTEYASEEQQKEARSQLSSIEQQIKAVESAPQGTAFTKGGKGYYYSKQEILSELRSAKSGLQDWINNPVRGGEGAIKVVKETKTFKEVVVPEPDAETMPQLMEATISKTKTRNEGVSGLQAAGFIASQGVQSAVKGFTLIPEVVKNVAVYAASKSPATMALIGDVGLKAASSVSLDPFPNWQPSGVLSDAPYTPYERFLVGGTELLASYAISYGVGKAASKIAYKVKPVKVTAKSVVRNVDDVGYKLTVAEAETPTGSTVQSGGLSISKRLPDESIAGVYIEKTGVKQISRSLVNQADDITYSLGAGLSREGTKSVQAGMSITKDGFFGSRYLGVTDSGTKYLVKEAGIIIDTPATYWGGGTVTIQGGGGVAATNQLSKQLVSDVASKVVEKTASDIATGGTAAGVLSSSVAAVIAEKPSSAGALTSKVDVKPQKSFIDVETVVSESSVKGSLPSFKSFNIVVGSQPVKSSRSVVKAKSKPVVKEDVITEPVIKPTPKDDEIIKPITEPKPVVRFGRRYKSVQQRATKSRTGLKTDVLAAFAPNADIRTFDKALNIPVFNGFGKTTKKSKLKGFKELLGGYEASLTARVTGQRGRKPKEVLGRFTGLEDRPLIEEKPKKEKKKKGKKKGFWGAVNDFL